MRISDWSSDVCSSDLAVGELARGVIDVEQPELRAGHRRRQRDRRGDGPRLAGEIDELEDRILRRRQRPGDDILPRRRLAAIRSEEHTSELQSLMRISYAVFCFKKKNITCRQQHT